MVFNNASSIHKIEEKSDGKVEPHFHGRCHVALKVEDLEQSLKDSNKNISRVPKTG